MKMISSTSRSRWMATDCSAILKRFYFLQREMVLMQAGWLPGVEHWQSKLLLPEFLWQDALVAKDLRERILELRYPERRIAPGEDRPLLEFWRQLRDAPSGEAFAAGLHRVVKPALRRSFQCYLETADALADAPTARILKQAVADADDQIRRWGEALRGASLSHPERAAEAERWYRGLERAFPAADSHWLLETPTQLPSAFQPSDFGGKPFQIARRGKRDKRFPYTLFPWPDSLDPKRGPGEGLELQIRQATHHLNEIWAAEMAGAALFDLADDAPPEFLEEAARWCFDEGRHCRMGYSRYLEWGFTMEEMPMGSFSYDAGAEADPVTRLGIIYYFESTYIHTKSERAKVFSTWGDRVSSHDMDFDWADELIHSYYGTHWLKHFLEQRKDPRGPNDIKKEAEACVQEIRARATEADRSATESAYRRTMERAYKLAQVAQAA